MSQPVRDQDANFSEVVASTHEKRTRWAWAIATLFGTGYFKPGPATYASAFVVLGWAALASQLRPQDILPVSLALGAVFIAIGIWVGTIVSRETGIKDPQIVVADEVAGQTITLAALGLSPDPLNWKMLLTAFLLFRVFDISKLPPLHWLERLPEGWGIMMDDVMAGIYGAAVILVIIHYRWF